MCNNSQLLQMKKKMSIPILVVPFSNEYLYFSIYKLFYPHVFFMHATILFQWVHNIIIAINLLNSMVSENQCMLVS